MNYVPIVKLIVIISLFVLARYIYKITDWHSRPAPEEGLKEKIVFYSSIVIFGIPILLICLSIPILTLKSIGNFLETAGFWVQIIFAAGAIGLYYWAKVLLEERERKRQKEKDNALAQKIKIDMLERMVKQKQ